MMPKSNLISTESSNFLFTCIVTLTWNKSAKNAVAMQCAIFSKAGMDFKNYSEEEKSLVRCCIKNITRKYTQDSYLQNENSSIFKIQDSLDSCK